MSVRVPPGGTHGVLFPRVVVRLLSRFTPGMFRRRVHRTGGGIPTLLLETHGAKTGKGRYAILGMEFQMGGLWYVEFTIRAAPGRDVARVTFILPM